TILRYDVSKNFLESDVGVNFEAMGMTTISYSPVRSVETQMKHRFRQNLLQATALTPRRIGASWIMIGGSLMSRRWKFS
ncbi:hypothetical protein HAX54_042477, partial [Datura stramonium]|nr:hypothetical protein [Datura stramonium]